MLQGQNKVNVKIHSCIVLAGEIIARCSGLRFVQFRGIQGATSLEIIILCYRGNLASCLSILKCLVMTYPQIYLERHRLPQISSQ